MKDNRPYKIIVDIHERENAITKALYQKKERVIEVKSSAGYDPTGDYIIVGRDGNEWGIERKSFLDAWQSICDHRIDGQLAQLEVKYPNRSIFMLEAPAYFPKNLQRKAYIVKKTVMTFFNDRSLIMPCWYVLDADYAATLMLKFAKSAHDIKISGRGIVVARYENL